MKYSTVLHITSNNPRFLPHGRSADGAEALCTVVVNGRLKQGEYTLKLIRVKKPSIVKKSLLRRLVDKAIVLCQLFMLNR